MPRAGHAYCSYIDKPIPAGGRHNVALPISREKPQLPKAPPREKKNPYPHTPRPHLRPGATIGPPGFEIKFGKLVGKKKLCKGRCIAYMMRQSAAHSHRFDTLKQLIKSKSGKGGGKGGLLKFLMSLFAKLMSSSAMQNAVRKFNFQAALKQAEAMVRDSLRNFDP
jgi:hypothetical protein